MKNKSYVLLQNENKELRLRLEEAEEMLRAISNYEVDAFIVSNNEKDKIVTFGKADYPYRAMIESMGEGAVSLIPDGSIIYCNSHFCGMIQTLPEELIDTPFQKIIVPDEQNRFKNFLAKSDEGSTREEFHLLSSSNVIIPVLLSSYRLTTDGTVWFAMIITDLTELKFSETELQKSQSILQSFYDSSPILMGVVELTEDDRLIHIKNNQATIDFFNVERQDMEGITTNELGFPLNIVESWTIAYRKSQAEKAPFKFEYIHPTKGGGKWLSVTVSLIGQVSTGNVRFTYVAEDISERKAVEEKLMFDSYHDHLTGLYNRRFFDEELNRLDVKRSLPISIIMADINGLKFTNDSFGHAHGDVVIKSAANILKQNFRAEDVLARIGGDEFMVVVINTDNNKAQEIIDRIKERISLNKDLMPFAYSISFGCATKIDEDEKIHRTVVDAEDKMYRNKLYDNKSMNRKMIDVLMSTLFEKSNNEAAHSKRVSEYCEAIASMMNLRKEDINKIKMAGLVHDIGKIGVTESILNKQGKLNNDEWEIMRKHPEASWRILSSSNEFAELAGYIHQHHEKLDGSGYPRGLKGDEISTEARIIAIADAYDAMTSQRSYRDAVSIDKAKQEIKRCSGTHFDPIIARIFVEKVVGKEW